MRALARGAPAWTITAALGVAYLIAAPPAPDLAAASYRSHLFSQLGFALWDNSWYAGHHLLAYSVLAPGLGALLGPRLVAVLSMIAATALFAAAIRGRFSARAERIAACWFALGASIALLSCRVPFDLGLAIGLGALALAQRRRLRAGLAVAALATVLCSLASPVAGAFLALAFIAWALAGPARARPLLLAALALVPILLLSVVFPEGGTQPFVASAFYPALAGVLVLGAAIPFKYPALRIGAALYALTLIGSYLVPSAVGGNVDRLGALAAGPIAALALAGALTRPRRLLLLVLAPALLYWQSNAPVADFAAAVTDPAANAPYYTPLLGRLQALGIGYGRRPVRIEAVATADHWEARWIAPQAMLARGWERQLDRDRNALFYSSRPPTPASYRAWLAREAVSYVALPDAPLDYSAKAEARLLGMPAVSGPGGYVQEIWRGSHWRLFAVLAPAPLARAPAEMTAVTPQSFTLLVPAPGSYLVKIHFTPYWKLDSGDGCVARSESGDWTTVRADRAGEQHVVIAFSPARVLASSARCG